jgi:glycosyltransferase 2 family protein
VTATAAERPAAHRGWAIAQVLGSVVLVGLLIVVFGTEPFLRAFSVVDTPAVLVALLLGLAAVLAQADRWRRVAHGYDAKPSHTAAVTMTYEANFLNMVLPGGVAGDAIRALRHPTEQGGRLRIGATVVALERLLGTLVTVLGAAMALLIGGRTPLATVLAFAGAAVLAAVLWPGLRRLGPRALLRAFAASVLMWGSLMALFVFGAATSIPGVSLRDSVALGAVCLAAMAIPLNVGGWGPRESITAVAAMLWGLPMVDGVTAAATYGVLALVGALPGGALVLLDTARRASGGAGLRLRRGEPSPQQAADRRP